MLNMSCMESRKDIHLERTTGCQSRVPRFDTTNGELLAQMGPTASNIAEGNLSTHERWNTLFTNTINILEGTVFRVTVIRYKLALPSVWMTFLRI